MYIDEYIYIYTYIYIYIRASLTNKSQRFIYIFSSQSFVLIEKLEFLGPTTKLMLRLPQGNRKQIRMYIDASLKVYHVY